MTRFKKTTDVCVERAEVYFLPVTARVPLKFGAATVASVTCARVRVTVRNTAGKTASGWGETPLSVPWFWPSTLSYDVRDIALQNFCQYVAERWVGRAAAGHPVELCHDFLAEELPALNAAFGAEHACGPLPYLAALGVTSCFDLATHDAYGHLHELDTYRTYTGEFLSRDLAHYLTKVDSEGISFRGKFPADFLQTEAPRRLVAWHLVGGVDVLDEAGLTGDEPRDGYPVHLRQWLATDKLRCLKIKLRGNDFDWDYRRIVDVAHIGAEHGALWLSTDYNCTVSDPEYVNAMLDQLRDEHPRFYGMLLYVEQPFPYDLEAHPIDVHSVSARKPLFLDESAHDWELVRLGRERGWSGVALKTCKTQTGALLSLCWARAHGMPIMVQDLTNPMLAQIPHVRLAAHAGTIMGVETNSMQFWPDASRPEAEVHPGLYRRRDGAIDLSALHGHGFGYRIEEIRRTLPPPACCFSAT